MKRYSPPPSAGGIPKPAPKCATSWAAASRSSSTLPSSTHPLLPSRAACLSMFTCTLCRRRISLMFAPPLPMITTKHKSCQVEWCTGSRATNCSCGRIRGTRRCRKQETPLIERTYCSDSRPWLARQAVSLRQSMIARAVEQLFSALRCLCWRPPLASLAPKSCCTGCHDILARHGT